MRSASVQIIRGKMAPDVQIWKSEGLVMRQLIAASFSAAVRQFKADGKRVQEEFGILQDELDSISRERDVLRSTLDALVTQIELNMDAEADEASNERFAIAPSPDNELVEAA